MKANELRIGNWVNNVINQPIQVGILQIKYSDDFNPIPLTEEWLVKFGFESNNSSSNFLTYYNERYDYRIEIYQDGDVWFDELRKIQHVHQLQNLYLPLLEKN